MRRLRYAAESSYNLRTGDFSGDFNDNWILALGVGPCQEELSMEIDGGFLRSPGVQRRLADSREPTLRRLSWVRTGIAGCAEHGLAPLRARAPVMSRRSRTTGSPDETFIAETGQAPPSVSRAARTLIQPRTRAACGGHDRFLSRQQAVACHGSTTFRQASQGHGRQRHKVTGPYR
jgi:hypothetical protein